MEKSELEIEISTLYNKVFVSWLATFILLVWFIAYIYPKFSEISLVKQDLITKIDVYEKLKSNWLSYSDFISQTKDESLKKMLSQDGKTFYENNLTNSKNIDYLGFLQEKEDYINEINKSNLVKKRDEKMSKVLPSYTEWFSVEWNMTDLAFVNYVESLLRTFQLKTSSKIWIDKLVLVQESDKKNENLSTQLFYIPLKLDLVWRKADIVEFLYFLQNVWSVSNINDNSIVFHKDNLINRTISWQKRTFDYNVYENKLVDVETIEFSKYIDTSSSLRTTNQLSLEWFLNFVRNGFEKNDEYNVIVNLKFYVKWLPTYKIELYVEDVIKKYKDMSKNVKDTLTKSQNRKTLLLNSNIVEIVSTLKTIDLYLTDMEKEIKKIEAWLKKKTDLNNLYKSATTINYELWNLEQYVSSVKLDENKK